MRIALYLNNLWGIAATSRIAVTLAKEFKKRGHNPFFIINAPPADLGREFKVIILKKKGELLRALELGKLLKRERTHLCLAFMRPQSTVLGITKLLYPSLGTLLVGSVHNTENCLKYCKKRYIPFRLIVKFLLERPEGLVAVSRGVEEDLREAFFINPKKIKVIYNPVDAEWVRKLSEEPLSPEEEEVFKKPVIVNVARHEKQKGLHHLLKVFKLVSERVDAHLLLIGEGSLTPQLKALAEELGVANRVFFLGWRENPFKYMRRSRLFLLTSLWEGLPMVLLEAMVLGLPVVAFRSRGGHVELLEGVSPLVDYPDEEAMARIAIRLFTDTPYREEVLRKQDERLANFMPPKVAEEYLSYFTELETSRRGM